MHKINENPRNKSWLRTSVHHFFTQKFVEMPHLRPWRECPKFDQSTVRSKNNKRTLCCEKNSKCLSFKQNVSLNLELKKSHCTLLYIFINQIMVIIREGGRGGRRQLWGYCPPPCNFLTFHRGRQNLHAFWARSAPLQKKLPPKYFQIAPLKKMPAMPLPQM